MIRNSFFGLSVARHALMMEQRHLDVSGRNVANANNAGYSRQELRTDSVGGALAPGGRPVLVRERDLFLDRMYRARNAEYGYNSARAEALERLEVIWGDMGDFGLRDELAMFWDSLQTLNNRPADHDARVQVLQRAASLSNLVNSVVGQLSEQRQDLDGIVQGVGEAINRLGRGIALLNQQIMESNTLGRDSANLEDQRDMLLDELSELTGATVLEQADGRVHVWIGGRPLVQGNHYEEIVLRPHPTDDGIHVLRWSKSGDPDDAANTVQFTGGRARGLLEARDHDVVDYQRNLVRMVIGMATAINDQHRLGFDMAGAAVVDDLFVIEPDPALNPDPDPLLFAISVNSVLVANPSLLGAATAADSGPSDGGNAQKMADLRHAILLSPPGSAAPPSITVDAYYRMLTASLGLDTQEAGRRVRTLQLQLEQVNERRLGRSGVSIDEEMVTLMQHQRAYQAAARTLTIMDEALDLLINRMGLVGR